MWAINFWRQYSDNRSDPTRPEWSFCWSDSKTTGFRWKRQTLVILFFITCNRVRGWTEIRVYLHLWRRIAEKLGGGRSWSEAPTVLLSSLVKSKTYQTLLHHHQPISLLHHHTRCFLTITTLNLLSLTQLTVTLVLFSSYIYIDRYIYVVINPQWNFVIL